MPWKELRTVSQETLFRGTRIRVETDKLDHSGEKSFELMFVDLGSEELGLSLLEISGYHTGVLLVTLPAESLSAATRGTNVEWLRKNFAKCVPFESKVMSVQVNTDKPVAEQELLRGFR